MGLADAAIPYLQRELAVCEKRQGLSHPDTLHSVFNLLSLYAETGRDADASALVEHIMQDEQASAAIRQLIGEAGGEGFQG
jgi:hypothetical protein